MDTLAFRGTEHVEIVEIRIIWGVHHSGTSPRGAGESIYNFSRVVE